MTLHPNIPKKLIRAALRYYCGSLSYQWTLVRGTRRINLDLTDGELPTEAEQHQAAVRLAEIKAIMKAHKAAKQQTAAALKAAKPPEMKQKPVSPVTKPKNRAEAIAAFKAKTLNTMAKT